MSVGSIVCLVLVVGFLAYETYALIKDVRLKKSKKVVNKDTD